MSTFPAGAHDDDVDSTTQALNYLRGSNLTYGLFEAYRRIQGEQNTPTVKTAEVDATSVAIACEMCGAAFIQKLNIGYRCGQCGFQWDASFQGPRFTAAPSPQNG